MNVGALKKILEKYDDNDEVRLNDVRGLPVLFTVSVADIAAVALLTEDDCNMADEFKCRFDAIDSGGMTADSVFSQMSEQGMTSDMVRRYLGDEYADRMKVWEDTTIENRIQHLWE